MYESKPDSCRICKSKEKLDPHHIISQGHAKKTNQLDLISNQGNIVYICRNCHNQTTASKAWAKLNLYGGSKNEMNCYYCDGKLIWEGENDISNEDEDFYTQAILSCSKCHSRIDAYLPKKEVQYHVANRSNKLFWIWISGIIINLYIFYSSNSGDDNRLHLPDTSWSENWFIGCMAWIAIPIIIWVIKDIISQNFGNK